MDRILEEERGGEVQSNRDDLHSEEELNNQRSPPSQQNDIIEEEGEWEFASSPSP